MVIGNTDSLDNGLYISVDWLSFTIKKNVSPETVVSMFGLDLSSFQTGLNGRYGYKSMIRHMLYPISILFNGNEDMGIHVDVSGSAVGFFVDSYRMVNTKHPVPFGGYAYEVETFDTTVLADLLKDIMDMGQLTRLDIAIDDIGCKYYTMDELTDIFNNGLYVSRFKKWKLNLEKGKAGTTGHSIYLGSRTSEIMFRIYDKKLERNSRKNAVPVTKSWVRWEIELHKNRASAVAMFLISGNKLSSVAIGVLTNYLRLIKRDNVRDSRCSTAGKWQSFVSGIQRIKLCQPVPEKTLEDKKKWVKEQVAPTLSAIYKIDGCLDFFYDLIQNGALRLSRELMHIIQRESYAIC